MRKKFSADECEVIGENPSFMEGIVPGTPIYKRPVTPRENFQLLFTGRKPYWIPQACFLCDEVQNFRPRIIPDNVACHLIFDGEAPYEYESNEMEGWFGLKWEYVDSIGGSTVHPGHPKITDINHWEEQIQFPDVKHYNWDECAEKNRDYLKTGNLRQLGILCGFWERLMAFMDVDNAAVAMIDEDQQEGVKRLFDKLADLYITVIKEIKKRLPIDCVLIHDDWAHQHAPFFSKNTVREMILPYLKRVIDFCHENGMFFELHCCGKAETLVPVMIEAGVDMWCGQTMNDYYEMAHTYKNERIVFGMIHPKMPYGATKEEIRKIAKKFVEDYKDCHVAIAMDDDTATSIFEIRNQDFLDAVYEYSRIEYQDKEE